MISRLAELELDDHDSHMDHAIESTCRVIFGSSDQFFLKTGFFIGPNEIFTHNDSYIAHEPILLPNERLQVYVIPHGFSISQENLVETFQCQVIMAPLYLTNDLFQTVILHTNYESNAWLDISFGATASNYSEEIAMTYYYIGAEHRHRARPIKELEKLHQGITRAKALSLHHHHIDTEFRFSEEDRLVGMGFCGGPWIVNGEVIGK